jgi:hypothetical protein
VADDKASPASNKSKSSVERRLLFQKKGAQYETPELTQFSRSLESPGQSPTKEKLQHIKEEEHSDLS